MTDRLALGPSMGLFPAVLVAVLAASRAACTTSSHQVTRIFSESPLLRYPVHVACQVKRVNDHDYEDTS